MVTAYTRPELVGVGVEYVTKIGREELVMVYLAWAPAPQVRRFAVRGSRTGAAN
jgi:hypothetical protein